VNRQGRRSGPGGSGGALWIAGFVGRPAFAALRRGERGGRKQTLTLDPSPIGWARGIIINRDADGFAAEHEPEDAEFPVLEAVDVGMGLVVEIAERAGGDEVFASAFAAREKEGNVGNLFGENVDGAIDPDDLLVGVAQQRAGIVAWSAVGPEGIGEGFLICAFRPARTGMIAGQGDV
jgi:hypothetical protein